MDITNDDNPTNNLDLSNVNERGPMKAVVDRYVSAQIERERKRLTKEKFLHERNASLLFLESINEKLDVIMKQNQLTIGYLERLANGPAGDVHYIKLSNYTKLHGEIFIDFIRGEKGNTRHNLPPSIAQFTLPYSKVFMIKIVNDGPAAISFQTNRHARMIDLYSGESDAVSENENFDLTELRISNSTDTNANVRITVYA